MSSCRRACRAESHRCCICFNSANISLGSIGISTTGSGSGSTGGGNDGGAFLVAQALTSSTIPSSGSNLVLGDEQITLHLLVGGDEPRDFAPALTVCSDNSIQLVGAGRGGLRSGFC